MVILPAAKNSQWSLIMFRLRCKFLVYKSTDLWFTTLAANRITWRYLKYIELELTH